MTKQIAKLRKDMKKVMDKKRFEHTLGVAYTSACLAMCHDENIEKAELAGLLHDCAKCMTNEERLDLCKKYALTVTEAEQKNPFLLHAKVGAALAASLYEVDDPDVLNAIRSHTTGRPGMSKLEKIVFVADYIEPMRTHSARLPYLRKLAFHDLDAALIEILKDTLDYLHTTDAQIDPQTQETYDYYASNRPKERKEASWN
ncbi:MAG: bis(5'-nucleosyl)-tetraphosphatase (symmetrical) YqeK [Lachnospiraceae bacterium]|nr:bis(5'-nucleosyl)-tetraphosphatase (symmetrical) YqeK [Lachnospiraceae bacterium]